MLSSLPLLGPNYITDTALLLIPEFLEKLLAKDAALAEKKTTLLLGKMTPSPSRPDHQPTQGRDRGSEGKT